MSPECTASLELCVCDLLSILKFKVSCLYPSVYFVYTWMCVCVCVCVSTSK